MKSRGTARTLRQSLLAGAEEQSALPASLRDQCTFQLNHGWQKVALDWNV